MLSSIMHACFLGSKSLCVQWESYPDKGAKDPNFILFLSCGTWVGEMVILCSIFTNVCNINIINGEGEKTLSMGIYLFSSLRDRIKKSHGKI